jgi:hypothetical protein
MNTLIQLIRSCNGHVYVTAGIIAGYFDDPAQARACAEKIQSQYHTDVKVCGCNVAVAL